VDDASLPTSEWYRTEVNIPSVSNYFDDNYYKGNPGSEENFGQKSFDRLMKRLSFDKLIDRTKPEMSMQVLLYVTNYVVAMMVALVFI
jgi:hypothetical protein